MSAETRPRFKHALVAKLSIRQAGKGSLDEQWNDWIIAHALIREANPLVHGGSTNADR